MSNNGQHGSKSQRQNQYVRRLMSKIARYTKRGWNVSGLERELAFMSGAEKRPLCRTGRDADPRFIKRHDRD